jgi:arsenate reductase (thioredoxin)
MLQTMIYKNIFSLLFLVFTISSFAQTQKKNKATEKPTILFVCEHGAARSTIASAYFNKLAREQGVNYRAIFRATAPDTVLTADTKKGLTDDGFDVSNWTPMMVSARDINSARRIITFDCNLPTESNQLKPVIQWNGIPPISKDYNVARDEIVKKIKQLIADLKNAQVVK